MVTMLLLVMIFVVAGFEHSIANIVLFSLALAAPQSEAGVVHNLLPITIGNIIAGGVFVGMVYMYVTKPAEKSASVEAKERISIKLLQMSKSRR
jgi:nitrite transporter NirC